MLKLPHCCELLPIISSHVLRTYSVKFVSCNPFLPNINSLINKYLLILHANLDLKKQFQQNLSPQFIEGTTLKAMLAPSCYLSSVKIVNLLNINLLTLVTFANTI